MTKKEFDALINGGLFASKAKEIADERIAIKNLRVLFISIMQAAQRGQYEVWHHGKIDTVQIEKLLSLGYHVASAHPLNRHLISWENQTK